MEEIETHYIFLDTSIFIKENFFAGNKLKSFIKHERESEIILLTTKITRKECISNLNKTLLDSNNVLNNFLKDLSNKAKTFKNVESLGNLFNLDKTFDFEKERSLLELKFNELINTHFLEIEIDPNKTIKVIDDYFNLNPPFKDGRKKSEFPDAFVLNSLETWCKIKKEKIYIVTDDEDMLSYKSDFLIPIKEYGQLLNKISFTFSKENITSKIDEIINQHETQIIAKIKDVFIDKFPNNGIDDNQGFEYETYGIEKFEAFIDRHWILYVAKNYATVELTIPVKYSVDTEYEDTSMGWYDKENDSWYGTETNRVIVSGDCILIVILEIEFGLPGKEYFWDSWEFKEITSGIPDNVKIM